MFTKQYRTKEENEQRKADILNRYSDLVAFVTNDLGYPPSSKAGKGQMFHCWNHQDRTPSLHVHALGYTCYSAACGEHGDLFKWVGWRNNLDASNTEDFFRIMDILDGGSFAPTPLPITQQTKGKDAPKPISPTDVLDPHQRFNEAMEYFGGRAISTEVGKAALLGYKVPYSRPYELMNRELVWTQCDRYTIPNIRGDIWGGGEVVGIAYRYDNNEIVIALQKLKQQHPADYAMIMRDLQMRAKQYADKNGTPLEDIDDLDYQIKMIFGGKYLNKGGSKHKVYGADYLVDPITKVRPIRHQCLIVEGQVDCLAARTAGYPCVAVPENDELNLKWLFEKVGEAIIVMDADEAGRKRGQWLYDKIAKPNTRMIEPQHGKDMDDECIKGTVHTWLKSKGIEPTL